MNRRDDVGARNCVHRRATRNARTSFFTFRYDSLACKTSLHRAQLASWSVEENSRSNPMDVTQELKDTENLLRDFVSSRLCEKLGSDWISQCGVSEERLQKWKDRKQTEDSRLVTGRLEERLIYYADFYDIQNILKKHWNHFSEVLGDLRVMDVFVSELGKLRDPDAHRRELLPHQKYLVFGIAGEIRTRITRWRSKLDTGDDCFPRIDFARDDLGNSYTLGSSSVLQFVQTNCVLRPGDAISFSVTASDPLGGSLSYRMAEPLVNSWQTENQFTYRIVEKNISTLFCIRLQIASPRSYHARADFDDEITFAYKVLPQRP